MQIQKGAKLVMEPREIIEKYLRKEIRQISIEEIDRINEIDISDVKEEYRKVYKALEEEMSINEISKKTKLSVADLYQKLFMMEMENLIVVDGGKYKRRN